MPNSNGCKYEQNSFSSALIRFYIFYMVNFMMCRQSLCIIVFTYRTRPGVSCSSAQVQICVRTTVIQSILPVVSLTLCFSLSRSRLSYPLSSCFQLNLNILLSLIQSILTFSFKFLERNYIYHVPKHAGRPHKFRCKFYHTNSVLNSRFLTLLQVTCMMPDPRYPSKIC